MTGDLVSKRFGPPLRVTPDLTENLLLAALASDVLDHLSRSGNVVPLERRTILYDQDDRLTHSFFPLSCVISFAVVLKDGKSAEIAVFGRESVAGYLGSVLGGKAFGRYTVQLPGWALKIPITDLQEAILGRPEIRRVLEAFSIAFTRQTFQCVACNACHPIEARCCRWILTMADRVEGDEVPITHETLAEMLGVQRSTVSVILRSLQHVRAIEQKRGEIIIIDRLALGRRACECYESIKTNYENWLTDGVRLGKTRS
ncbi:MAG: Crp/Fnr family transcriptional regulator [Hyphomicrobiales bacterium]|nr:Crp/Fnr family transcriptional regulator [Hyphomicrobiales bacterium]